MILTVYHLRLGRCRPLWPRQLVTRASQVTTYVRTTVSNGPSVEALASGVEIGANMPDQDL